MALISQLWLSICLVLLINPVDANKLLLILVDGFRWDYFHFPDTTLNGFTRIFKHGSKAKWLTPEFPTNSFPNYKTLETGLHIESHGFVGNYMYDAESRKTFSLEPDNKDFYLPMWWNNAESFYITAEKQNIHTSLYFIPGCEVKIDGITSTYCIPYDYNMTHEKEVWAIQDALKKLRSGEVDIAYMLLWNVDKMGHLYGPNSKPVREAVLDVDAHINDILDIIEDNQQNNVNVIIVSDHGLSTIDTLHKINISEALDMNDILKITEGGTQAYVWPKSGKEKEVYHKLKTFHPHLKVYYRSDILDRWFFKEHTRIPPVFVTVDKGWYLVHPMSSNKYFENEGLLWQGNHGFDNNDSDMRGIFVAYGPDILPNNVVDGFDIVNVYQLICKLSGIRPHPHNGTWSTVEPLLVHSHVKDEF